MTVSLKSIENALWGRVSNSLNIKYFVTNLISVIFYLKLFSITIGLFLRIIDKPAIPSLDLISNKITSANMLCKDIIKKNNIIKVANPG